MHTTFSQDTLVKANSFNSIKPKIPRLEHIQILILVFEFRLVIFKSQKMQIFY